MSKLKLVTVTRKSLVAILPLVISFGYTPEIKAGPFSMSYGGRLTDAQDKSILGPVDIDVAFYRAATGGSPIAGVSVLSFTAVSLSDGIFQVSLSGLSSIDQAIIFTATDEVWVEVKNVTNNQVMLRQRFTAIPYALRIPVDGQSLVFNAIGELTTGVVNASKIGGNPVNSTAPSSGDVLSWNGTAWSPAAAAGGGGGAVSSVNGQTGVVSLNSDNLAEGSTNKFYTDARSRGAVSATGPLAYNSGTGVLSVPQANGSTAGYLSSADWSLFNSKQSAIANTDAMTEGSTNLFYTNARARSAISASGALSYNSGTGALSVSQSSSVSNGILTSNDWLIFNNKQSAVSSTTDLATRTVTTAGQAALGVAPYGAAAGQTGEIRFGELGANGSDYVGFKAPDSIAGPLVWKLPAADGSTGTVLSTNGSGILSWIAPPSAPVSSVNGQTGAVSLNSDNLAEGSTNKFYTDVRSRGAVSATGPLAYNSGTGVLSVPQANGSTAGYLSSADWSLFNSKQSAIANTDAMTEGSTNLFYTNARARSAISASGSLSYNSGTGALSVSQSSSVSNGILTSTDWLIFNNKQSAVSSTTDLATRTVTTAGQAALGLAPYGAAAGQTGEIRFGELGANGSDYVGFKAPDSIAGPLVWKLPAADGSTGTVLSTNGSGILSWIAPPSAPVSSVNGQTGVVSLNSDNVSEGASNKYYTDTRARSAMSGVGAISYNSSTGAISLGTISNSDISAGAAIGRTKIASGTANHVLVNDGSGNISSEAALAQSRGGTGISSTATFPSSGVIVTESAANTLTNKTLNGASNTITNISASQLTSGTVPNAAFPAVLPAANGSNLTGLNAENMTTNIGTADQVLKVNTAGTAPVWADQVAFQPSRALEMYDEFLNNGLTTLAIGQLQWTLSGTGTITVPASTSSESNHPGLIQLNTPATASTYAAMTLGTDKILLGGGTLAMEAVVQLPLALAAGQKALVGLGDTITAANPIDGVWFDYTNGTATWSCNTRANGSVTSNNSGVNVAQATWYKMKIIVDAAAANAYFYINGTLVCTNSTGIPSGTGRQTSPMLMAWTTTAAIHRMIVDYYYLNYAFTTPR